MERRSGYPTAGGPLGEPDRALPQLLVPVGLAAFGESSGGPPTEIGPRFVRRSNIVPPDGRARRKAAFSVPVRRRMPMFRTRLCLVMLPRRGTWEELACGEANLNDEFQYKILTS